LTAFAQVIRGDGRPAVGRRRRTVRRRRRQRPGPGCGHGGLLLLALQPAAEPDGAVCVRDRCLERLVLPELERVGGHLVAAAVAPGHVRRTVFVGQRARVLFVFVATVVRRNSGGRGCGRGVGRRYGGGGGGGD